MAQRALAEEDEGELPPEPSIPSSDGEGEDFARGLPWKSREQINMLRWVREHDRRMSEWVNAASVDKKEDSDALARQLYKEMRAEAKAREDLHRRRRRHDRRERGDRGNESDRITELECDNVDEAGCYNYTENELTRTQIRFVQEHLKNAHESFVVHHSNRHNYGKVALMDLSEDAYVEPVAQAVYTAMTRAKNRETSELLQWFQNWEDPDGLNKAILEEWDTKKSNDSWYARATKNSTQGGGDYAASQAVGAQVRLIFDIFKSYKNAAAWWKAYKGSTVFPGTKRVRQGSDEFRLREGIVTWLVEDTSVTYETTNRAAYLKVARVLWEFMDTISDYLDANQVDYEAEKTKWGTYDGAEASERRLDKLLGTVTEEQEVARDSETRAALRAKVKDVEALIAKTAPGSRKRRNVTEIVRGPLDDAKRLLQDTFSNPTHENTQRRTLHLAFFSALRDVAGNTSEQLAQHFQRQKDCALALIREIGDIGYQNEADTPEYVELVEALRAALERRKQRVLLSETDYELVWSLHRAYDHAFAAVYGDSSEVGAFKSAFEERAVARANEGSVTEGAGADHEGHAALARVVQRRREELKADLDAIASRAF
jgi:hypothetical protein